MCLVLGFMVSMAWLNDQNRTSRYNSLPGDVRSRIAEGMFDPDAYKQLQTEVNNLQVENTKLQGALAKKSSTDQHQNDSAKLLNDSLQKTKEFAGLTAIEGPGITITLKDSVKSGQGPAEGASMFPSDAIIHDTDVLRTVNELWASGAEAISVNDHRVAGPTSYRCVGPTILLNGDRIATPIFVRAVGDPSTLYGAMNLPGGVLAEIRSSDPSMVQVDKMKKLALPAYAGPTEIKIGKVPKESS